VERLWGRAGDLLVALPCHHRIDVWTESPSTYSYVFYLSAGPGGERGHLTSRCITEVFRKGFSPRKPNRTQEGFGEVHSDTWVLCWTLANERLPTTVALTRGVWFWPVRGER
jgi:hypothetical protein